MRRSLAEDLNRLLERELKIKERLNAKKQEKDAVDQEIADGSTSERLRQKQEQLGDRDRRAVQDRPALRAGALQAGAAFGIPDRFHQGEPAELDPHPAEPAAAGSGLPEGNRPEPGRGLPGPRDLHRPRPTIRSAASRNTWPTPSGAMQAQSQLKPGEDVKIIDNRVQVSGQVAVMNINGLLTKVIFDHNPKNEFFVEESFPLDWMYPHLTPFGIIMKINRQPLPVADRGHPRQRDHQFWKQFSKRLTGDIVDYDTPVKTDHRLDREDLPAPRFQRLHRRPQVRPR